MSAFMRRVVSASCDDTSCKSLRSLALGLTLIGALMAPLHARAATGPIVDTTAGKVEGLVTNNVAEFLGIPYAKPPVGGLRWMPPVAHSSWSGTRKTVAFGPNCAQITELGVFAGPANNNEDCLYLNVFTPNVSSSAKLPVLFWIHGGGNEDGESSDYDGSKLAAQGRTVVVTVNYRLNLMGFLAVPSLDSEGHHFANYGIMDQQLALNWVHNNIAKFGGDPKNVTVGGQSAGAEDTGIHMISPLDAGLFQRALCESGCPSTYYPSRGLFPTVAQAEAVGTNFAVAAGCGSKTGAAQAKCLRSLTAAQVEALAGTASTASPYVLGPILDGTIIPIQPIDAWNSGAFTHMPLINGNTLDEENFTLAISEYFSGPPRTPITSAQYMSAIASTYVSPPFPAGTSAKILSLYPVGAYSSAQVAWDRAGTDPFLCAERQVDHTLGSQIPVYAYEFDDQTAPFFFPKMPGFVSLAYHTADIQYLFPLWHGGPLGIAHPLNAQQTKLSDELVAAWTNFAATGNPNGVGSTPWPVFPKGTNKPAFLSQNIPVLSTFTDTQYRAQHHCDFWDSIATY